MIKYPAWEFRLIVLSCYNRSERFETLFAPWKSRLIIEKWPLFKHCWGQGESRGIDRGEPVKHWLRRHQQLDA
jgi:hypothetical protein